MSAKIAVALTGVSGFIGSRICADLVAKNFAVHAIVRNNKNNSDLQQFGNSVSIFEVPDLGKGDLTPAFSGCQYVIHVASPVAVEGKSEDEVLTPAVDNTLNVLRTAKKLGTKRVVITSTMASMCGSQREKDPTHVWTENDWNDKPGSLYSRSKVLQEKTAWDFVKENPEVELVTVHPAMVLGPVTFPSSLSIVSYVLNVAKGNFKEKGLPPMTAGVSDVRDVSAAHIAALENPKSANQRYIVALPDQISMLSIAKSIKKQFPQLDVVEFEEKATNPVLNGIDASKAKSHFNMEFTSFDKTVHDTIQSLMDHKLIK